MKTEFDTLKFKQLDDEHWDVFNKTAGYQLAELVYYGTYILDSLCLEEK